MAWQSPPATEHQKIAQGRGEGLDSRSEQQEARLVAMGQHQRGELIVQKRLCPPGAPGKAAVSEVFTLSLEEETIELLPFKSWALLDHFKWTARGKFPGEPAGLEITKDTVRIAGETIGVADPEGCAKLQRLFNEWLRFERENVELACKKARPHGILPASQPAEAPTSPRTSFRVEVDKGGQVHIHCLKGHETLASIGLTVAGFNSLYQQGLIHRPRTLETGALHDWVELDGEFFQFDSGHNDAGRLEQLLNSRYAPLDSSGPLTAVTVNVNAASPTGFDLQFPVLVGGAPQMQHHHLTEESLALLQDSELCGLLHKNIIIKLIPPNLVFKVRTMEGGEQYLPWCPQTTVSLTDQDSRQSSIRLSQPLNLLRLSAAELTAVFNHPAINRHTTPPAVQAFQTEASARITAPGEARSEQAHEIRGEISKPKIDSAQVQRTTGAGGDLSAAKRPSLAPQGGNPANLWLRSLLSLPVLQPEWFAWLVYTKAAEHFGNSTEGKLGPVTCWFIHLGEVEDPADPAFKGIFLSKKGSLGFLHLGMMARFYNGLAFLGSQKSPLEGIDIDLLAMGRDGQGRVVFIISDNYRRHFGVTEALLHAVLKRLEEHGVVVFGASEAVASLVPLEVVWTVPADQPDADDPQAAERIRPR